MRFASANSRRKRLRLIRHRASRIQELVKDNKSRVAYMYIFSEERSSFAPATSERMARSLYCGGSSDEEVFREESSEFQEFQTSYNGYDIFFRPFPYYGALYSTPAVDHGARRFPFTRQNIGLYGSFKGRYTDREDPIAIYGSGDSGLSALGAPSSQVSWGSCLESVWFYRNDEGQLSSPITGGCMRDQPPRLVISTSSEISPRAVGVTLPSLCI